MGYDVYQHNQPYVSRSNESYQTASQKVATGIKLCATCLSHKLLSRAATDEHHICVCTWLQVYLRYTVCNILQCTEDQLCKLDMLTTHTVCIICVRSSLPTKFNLVASELHIAQSHTIAGES